MIKHFSPNSTTQTWIKRKSGIKSPISVDYKQPLKAFGNILIAQGSIDNPFDKNDS
jgi:hypothetical protein